MYFINGFAGFVESMKPLQKICLFYHYRSGLVGGVDWRSWTILMLISLVICAVAVPAFNRRDIYG